MTVILCAADWQLFAAQTVFSGSITTLRTEQPLVTTLTSGRWDRTILRLSPPGKASFLADGQLTQKALPVFLILATRETDDYFSSFLDVLVPIIALFHCNVTSVFSLVRYNPLLNVSPVQNAALMVETFRAFSFGAFRAGP